MLALIDDEMAVPEPSPPRTFSVVMDTPAPIEVRPPAEVAKPADPKPPPDWQSKIEPITTTDKSFAFTGPAPTLAPGDTDLKNGTGGGIFAYVKVQPIYPNSALRRGVEGFVDLAFDITSAGSTTNIRVIDAQPDEVFNKAAIRALEKWKYKVPSSEESATGQKDMMTRIRFALEAD